MRRRWREPAPTDRARYQPAEVFAAGLRNHHIANTAYPIAHQQTWRPYRVPRDRVAEVALAAWEGIRDHCLYVHIPFCEVRCSFCEYTVVRRREHERTREYVDDLLVELERWADALGAHTGRVLHGCDIGGGTPSFLPAAQMDRIVEAVRGRFRFAPGADLSIETTPRIAGREPDKIAAYREMGIDRISMGIQVIQPDLLKLLNRSGNGIEHHSRAVANIRRAGFERLNLDLMFGFAGQSAESWRATLEHAIALEPEYITLYRMRYKLTRISHQAPRVTLGHVRPLIELSKRLLREAGYHANPGKTTFSRLPGDVGTSSYLARRVQEGMPYLGVGLGAQSLTHTTISYNSGSAGKNLTPYHRDVGAGQPPIQDLYDLPARQMMGKVCAVSFYFGEIRLTPFRRKFGVELEEVFPDEVAFLFERGLMEYTDRGLSLTARGSLYKNGVIPLFAAPSIQRYLLDRDPEGGGDLERNRRMALRVAGE